MDPGEDTLYFKNREEWREWLKINHNSRDVVWLLYYKRHTGRPRVQYNEAVEEAVCFGWIDSIIKRVDEVSYCQKFTPRREGSRWSESNIRRAREMIELGKMTPPGLSRYMEAVKTPSLIIASTDNKEMLDLPDDIFRALQEKGEAYRTFVGFSRSYRNMCIRWIESAKRSETRQRRIAELVERSKSGEKIGLK